MKTRLLAAALVCCLSGAPIASFAQAPKKDEKKAPAPKSATEQAFDEFQKIRNQPGAKQDQARFQQLITAGTAFVMAHPANYRTNEVVNYLGVGYPMTIDAKKPELRIQYVSLLKLEVSNQKYKDGVTDPVKAALMGLDTAATEFEVRMANGARDSMQTFREKIDEVGGVPGGGRFVADREKAYLHLLMMMNQTPRAEEALKKLVTHKEKGVADMAKAELAMLEVRKVPVDFKATGLDGKPVDLATLRGKAVGLYFWTTGSKSSTDALTKLQQYASD
ncbi:MAG: hypothetical protein V4773_12745, partial [Verrucomicrobiota bacterium]